VDDSDCQEQVERLFAQLDSLTLTDYREAMIEYIAGFIVRKLVKEVSCIVCANALQDPRNTLCLSDTAPTRFISCINRGGLVVPTKSVVQIVRTAEKAFKLSVSGCGSKPEITSNSHLFKLLSTSVNRHLFTVSLFESLLQHDLDHACITEDLHSTQLQKAIVNKYLLLRALTYGKDYTKRVIQRKKEGLRQQHNKLVIFNNL
jgi:hypothetical protein